MGDIHGHEDVILRADQTLKEAVQIFAKYETSTIPVMDNHQNE
jgi:Mg/Co/Ni transporter MgtE